MARRQPGSRRRPRPQARRARTEFHHGAGLTPPSRTITPLVQADLAAMAELRARWASLERWVGSRASAAALFAVALVVFAVQSAVLPAYQGRDMSRYLEAFFQLGYHVPVYPAVINTRGPLAAAGVAVPLWVSGWFAEVFLGVLYALSILAWSRVAWVFGARAAIATSVLLL